MALRPFAPQDSDSIYSNAINKQRLGGLLNYSIQPHEERGSRPIRQVGHDAIGVAQTPISSGYVSADTSHREQFRALDDHS